MSTFYKRIVFENASIFFISVSLLLMINIIITENTYLIDLYFIIETIILITVFRRFALLIQKDPSKTEVNIFVFSILLTFNFGFACFHQISIHVSTFNSYRLIFELSYRIFVLIVSILLLIIGIILVYQTKKHIKTRNLLNMNKYVCLTPDARSKISDHCKQAKTAKTSDSKKTNNGITEMYFGKRKLQIIILCSTIMVCSLGEVVLCIVRNFVMYNEHFRLDNKSIKAVTLSGVIVNSLLILTCLISTTAFYASFYWVVKDNFIEYFSEENENDIEEEAGNPKERMLSFSDDDIAEYNNLKKNKEIEGFLDKSKLEEPTTKKKKAKKKNSDSFSALESNNKSFDLVDAYNKKVQPTIITEEDSHTIIIEQ